MIDREFTLGALREVIRIDSRNPGLEAGAPGEWELAEHVRTLLGELGWSAELHDLGGGRANVVATRRGTQGGPSLMINVHLDTVGVAGMKEPFSAAHRDGRIWGRGAQDTKGGMAAILGAAKALAEENAELPGDLVLAFVADEENESIGTTHLLEQVRTDAAIVIEPSDLDVCIAHRGLGVFRVRTRGRRAHGGRSDLGIDANLHMGHVLVALDGLRQRWRAEHHHAALGSATLHVPLIAGGRQLFIYSDACTIDVECRTVPGQQTADAVLGELRAELDKVRERIDDFDAVVEPVLWRSPWEIGADRPIVRTVLAAAERVRGEPVRTIAHGWWEDAALLGEAGIDTVVIGPRGGGMHTEEEWVDPDSVIELAEILYQSVRACCGAA